MKRKLVFTILGIAATISASADFDPTRAYVQFDNYNSYPDAAAFAWTTEASLAPPGLAGKQLDAESSFFTAKLWFGLGASPSTWYSTGESVTPTQLYSTPENPYPGRGGWIFGGTLPVSGGAYPDYSMGPYTFQIQVTGHGPYENYGGLVQFTEPNINLPGLPQTLFTQLPNNYLGDFGAGDRFGLLQVIQYVPEPSTFALVSLAATGILILRRQKPSSPSQ